jgi:hypothetical protein
LQSVNESSTTHPPSLSSGAGTAPGSPLLRGACPRAFARPDPVVENKLMSQISRHQRRNNNSADKSGRTGGPVFVNTKSCINYWPARPILPFRLALHHLQPLYRMKYLLIQNDFLVQLFINVVHAQHIFEN